MKELTLTLLFLAMIPSITVRADVVVEPTLSVRGEATVKAQADQVEIRIGVQTSAKTAKNALQENSRLMNEVRKQLAREGLEQIEFKTGSFSIHPQWSQRPRQASQDWKAMIVGYVASNHLEVETSKLEKIGEWINAATEAGANNIGQLRFSLQDPDSFRNQAIKLATQKARGYAMAAAEAADVRLVSISAVQVDGASVQPVLRQRSGMMEMAKLQMSDGAMAPQVTAGEIEVRANVSLSYKVEN